MRGYILVVDDQPPIRFVFEEILRQAGYMTKSAANGLECLKIARSEDKPLLILLDYQMPSLTGIEVLSRLKREKTTQGIPVIMVTGTEDIEEIAKEKGADAVLAKPPDLEQLQQIVQKTQGSTKHEQRPDLQSCYTTCLIPMIPT